MIAVVQRVSRAQVTVGDETVGQIGQGFLVLLGVTPKDGPEEAEYLARKVAGLRVFEDREEKMNLSLGDVGGGVLVVSNFTLCADCKKGNRPSFVGAARPEQAEPLYERFVQALRLAGIERVETGRFGAMMEVSLTNSGPVTLKLDTDGMLKKST